MGTEIAFSQPNRNVSRDYKEIQKIQAQEKIVKGCQ